MSVDTKRARQFADKLEKQNASAAGYVRDLADEVDRLWEMYRDEEESNRFDLETKWGPLLAAAKEEGNKHNYPCMCKLCLRIAACEEK